MALNFVQRLSGVATLTGQFVEAIKGTRAQILDTRKTTPGWRRLEKYAVACGGGRNHRMGLFDMVLIKDNHLAALKGESPNAIAAAVARAHTKYPHLKLEVEAIGLLLSIPVEMPDGKLKQTLALFRDMPLTGADGKDDKDPFTAATFLQQFNGYKLLHKMAMVVSNWDVIIGRRSFILSAVVFQRIWLTH